VRPGDALADLSYQVRVLTGLDDRLLALDLVEGLYAELGLLGRGHQQQLLAARFRRRRAAGEQRDQHQRRRGSERHRPGLLDHVRYLR
jgi:hypothetical protein